MKVTLEHVTKRFPNRIHLTAGAYVTGTANAEENPTLTAYGLFYFGLYEADRYDRKGSSYFS